MKFQYDRALLEEFPSTRAAVVHVTGVTNGPSPPGLLEDYRREQEAVVSKLDSVPIAEIPSIAAWRRVFSRFGVKPTKYRLAAEALLRRLSKQGDIPSISTLVDIGNLVSVRYAVPVAVFDLASIVDPLVVRFATGTERFTDLASTEVVQPEPGEVIFVDSSDDVSARRWCWRQGARSATGPDTADALIVVEGHHEGAADDMSAAVSDLRSLLATHMPESNASTWLLSPERPETA